MLTEDEESHQHTHTGHVCVYSKIYCQRKIVAYNTYSIPCREGWTMNFEKFIEVRGNEITFSFWIMEAATEHNYSK